VIADERIDYRIGVNLGDTMIDTNHIAGDGVNVASRLESLAEPGGICVSTSIREQVHGQMNVTFTDIGEQQVKNISRPIRAFAVALVPVMDAGGGSGRGVWQALRARLSPSSTHVGGWRRRALAILLMILIAAGLTAIWLPSRIPAVPDAPALSVGDVPLAAATERPGSSALREPLTRDVATQLARASSAIRIVPAPEASAGSASVRGVSVIDV